jgi:hypothetical protein
MCLKYERRKEYDGRMMVEAYSDADWGGDVGQEVDDRLPCIRQWQPDQLENTQAADSGNIVRRS